MPTVQSLDAMYKNVRCRICELVMTLDDEERHAPVPACPGWSVHDVLAHLAGVSADILCGNISGLAREHWTAAQVEARRDASVADLVGEWSRTGPRVEAMKARFSGRAGEHLVADVVIHEQDVRGAVGREGARDSDEVKVVLDSLLTRDLASSLVARGLGAVQVSTDGREWTVGPGAPVASVEAPPFELFRAASGRRSPAQLRALAWSGDLQPYIAAFQFGPFIPSAVDIVE
jgi:uncharacterized protein (TIGR03083 family)